MKWKMENEPESLTKNIPELEKLYYKQDNAGC